VTELGIALVLALFCFAVSFVCARYLTKRIRRIHWSQSRHRYVINHKNPRNFWARFYAVAFVGFLFLGLGVLLLFAPGHHFWMSQPTGSDGGDNGRSLLEHVSNSQ
jgi:drug/metabolite transporter (DMT)-like permease